MKRLEAAGLSLVLGLSLGACSEQKQPESIEKPKAFEGDLLLTTTRDGVDLLAQQNRFETKVGSLEAGRKVVALCFSESYTLGMDSVKVSIHQPINIDTTYAFIGERSNKGDIVPNFNASPTELKQKLPTCD